MNSHNTLQSDEFLPRRNRAYGVYRPAQCDSPQRQQGRLRIFYYAHSHLGVVLDMLREAHTARRRGIDIVIGPLPLKGGPQRQLRRISQMRARFECLSDADVDLNWSAALRRRPAIIATSRPLPAACTRATDAVLDRWYLGVETLLESGIDVWAALYGSAGKSSPRTQSAP